MSNHTPSPWELERDPSHYNSLSTVVGGEESSKCHGRQMVVNVGGFAKLDEQEANARLIASAPELLEALKQALEALGGNDPQDLNFDDGVCGLIRQAIAKAEGNV